MTSKATRKRKNTTTRLAWIATGICSIFCVLLVALLFIISEEDKTPNKLVEYDDVIDLLDSPTQKRPRTVDINSPEVGVTLRQGGWVHQTDAMGNIVQQYRCSSVNPEPLNKPSGCIEMEELEIELFLSNNKLVRITGDSCFVYKEKSKKLESGEITGNVRVQLYETNQVAKKSHYTPSMELQTTSILFNSATGEINCPNDVRVTSVSKTLFGKNLSVRYNDIEERVEYLRLAELDYIEFIPGSKVASSTPTPFPPTRQPLGNQQLKLSQHKIHAAAVGDDLEYYLVTFSNNVHIVQGDSSNGRYAKGDTLTISFSNQSDSKTTQNNRTNNNASQIHNQISMRTIPTAIVAVTLGTVEKQLSEEPVRLTCEGGFDMVPIDDPALIPSTPSDTRIELFASKDTPAELVDKEQSIQALGTKLRYEVQQARTDLFGEPARLVMNDAITSANHLMMTTTKNRSLDKVVCSENVALSDQSGSVHCETLTVTFDKDSEGSSSPSLAIASGEVKVIGENQTLWANEVQVSFEKSVPKARTSNDTFSKESHAKELYAKGDIQILLSDGGRAFCNELVGNIAEENATLTGNVVIAYQRMLMHHGESAVLTLDHNSGKGKWAGGGQALFLNTPFNTTHDNRIARPTIQLSENKSSDNAISMRTDWSEEMNIDQHANSGAGAIELLGDVQILSKQDEYQRSKVTSKNLRLVFAKPTAKNTQKNTDARELKKVIAIRGAKIEHRTKDALNPTLHPSVYYIDGNYIELDFKTHDALVQGNGSLVLSIPPNPDTEAQQQTFAGGGDTLFEWNNKLSTTKLHGNTYEIQMLGGVTMLHQGPDGSTSALQSDTLTITAIDPQQKPTDNIGGPQLAMRGLDVRQIKATGSVKVTTETKSVDCDTFIYSPMTGIAELSANANQTISITTAGSNPVRASSILWNMDPTIDTVTFRNLQGTSGN